MLQPLLYSKIEKPRPPVRDGEAGRKEVIPRPSKEGKVMNWAGGNSYRSFLPIEAFEWILILM